MSICIKQIFPNNVELVSKTEGESVREKIECGNGVEKIVIESDEKYLHILWENVINQFVVYIPNGRFEFSIPTGEALRGFAKDTFKNDNYMQVSVAKDEQIQAYRNLALNPLDYRLESEIVDPNAEEWSNPTNSAAVAEGEVCAFPHVYANRVTRNEGCFYARNAIDGVVVSNGHGDYPYHSWGGAVHEDLTLVVYFGRPVRVDKLGLCLRSDYRVNQAGQEHDTYWHTALVELSDGYEEEIHPKKLAETQYFELGEHTTTYLKLSRLDPLQHSGSENFAALTQIEVWGNDIK